MATTPAEGELRARQQLELVGRLSLGIAHDFNNMLAIAMASMGYIRNLDPIERANPDVDESISDAMVALDRASELSQRLLNASGRNAAMMRKVDMTRLCEEVVKLVRRTLPRAIHVDAFVDGKLCVLGSEAALQQVLTNLCVNARDAMGDSGTLSITATRGMLPSVEGVSPHVVIRIKDTGHGMDMATQSQIFEPFFTTKSRGKGFGLGLATVSEIVTMHGGQIDVESQVGQGTEFTIRLAAGDR